jgi:hypothetical protein
MFKIELITLTVPAAAFVLCDSTRSLAEHNVRLNGQRVLDYVDYVRAAFATAFDMGNRRNILSFDVSRDVDFAGNAFRDPEAAFAWALDHDAALPVVSHCRITLKGRVTNEVRWLDNATVQTTQLTQIIGVAHKYNYTINAGAISKTRPTIPA